MIKGAYWTLRTCFCVVFLVTSADCRRYRRWRKNSDNQLRVKNCGPASPAIQINDLHIRPMPVRLPGKIKVSGALNVTRNLPPRVTAHVTVVKYFWGLPMKLPCMYGIGSCIYKDICAILRHSVKKKCAKKMRSQNLPCQCPFIPGIYTASVLRIRLPALDKFVYAFAKGQFEVKLQLIDDETQKTLMCYKASFGLKPRHKQHTWAKRML